jgi:vacuolar-type H+-ATPase subunit I/STV1
MLGEDDKCAKCRVETEYLTFSIFFRPDYVKKGELFEGDWLCDNCFREETPPSYYEVEKDRNEPLSVLEEKVDGLKEIIEQNIDKVNSKLDNIQVNQERQSQVLAQQQEQLKAENIVERTNEYEEEQKKKNLLKNLRKEDYTEEQWKEFGEVETSKELANKIEKARLTFSQFIFRLDSPGHKIFWSIFLLVVISVPTALYFCWDKIMKWWNKPLFKWALEEEKEEED